MKTRTEEQRMLDGPFARAVYSDDDVYRFLLTREQLLPGALDFQAGNRVLVSIGLNPSTATAFKDDPTIRRDKGFARHWGCGRLWKLNAKAYRATKPADMHRAARGGVDVVGRPTNDEHIRQALREFQDWGGKVVVSWGSNLDEVRQLEVYELITAAGITPMCLGTNDNGSPKHELYLPYETPLVAWSPPASTRTA